MAKVNQQQVGAGLLFAAMGVASIFINQQPAADVPYWMIRVASAFMILFGLTFAFFGWGMTRAALVVGLPAVGLLLFSLHWIAFGPGGERVCASSGAIANLMSCRQWFGAGALFFDLAIVGVVLLAFYLKRK